MLTEPLVRLERENQVAWLTLTRPQARNSFDVGLCRALLDAVAACEADDAVRVLVLTGEGRTFCAGGCLKTISSFVDQEEAERFVKLFGACVSAIVEAAKPVIAMVNGAAVGAGFNLALACDLVVASETAVFTETFSSIGLSPNCGGSWLLPRAVGPHRAKELLFFATPIEAALGQALGFVNHVYPPGELREKTRMVAEGLAARAPLAVRGAKALVNRCGELPLDAMLAEEAALQSFLMMGEDGREGVASFLEKRPPRFKGRS